MEGMEPADALVRIAADMGGMHLLLGGTARGRGHGPIARAPGPAGVRRVARYGAPVRAGRGGQVPDVAASGRRPGRRGRGGRGDGGGVGSPPGPPRGPPRLHVVPRRGAHPAGTRRPRGVVPPVRPPAGRAPGVLVPPVRPVPPPRGSVRAGRVPRRVVPDDVGGHPPTQRPDTAAGRVRRAGRGALPPRLARPRVHAPPRRPSRRHGPVGGRRAGEADGPGPDGVRA
ncbi:hypothetical protein THAOC_29916, partial [Thalassiosira oceanica]